MKPYAVSKAIVSPCSRVDFLEDTQKFSGYGIFEKVAPSLSSTDSVMSARLSSNFAELKKLSATLGSAKKRSRDGGDSEDTTDDNAARISRHTENDMSGIADRQQRLAEETTVLATQEVQRMRDAVAELEAILAAGDNACNIVSPYFLNEENSIAEDFPLVSRSVPPLVEIKIPLTSTRDTKSEEKTSCAETEEDNI